MAKRSRRGVTMPAVPLRRVYDFDPRAMSVHTYAVPSPGTPLGLCWRCMSQPRRADLRCWRCGELHASIEMALQAAIDWRLDLMMRVTGVYAWNDAPMVSLGYAAADR